MEFARKNKEQLIDLYAQGFSTYAIAEKLDTYASKVRNALIFLGVPMRGYGEAQAAALKVGRSVHPTKGKTLSEDLKRRIGEQRSKTYSELSDEEKKKISQVKKEQWENMTESEKHNLRSMAALAVREASKSGSKTEKFVKEGMENEGWTVHFHVKNLIPSEQLEVDLYLPEIKTVVEIDGPTHFLPIWGEDKLKRHIKADSLKSGLLLASGYAIIRVRQLDRSVSVKRMNDMFLAVLEEAKKIREKFPEKTKRLIEIEVKDGKVRRI